MTMNPNVCPESLTFDPRFSTKGFKSGNVTSLTICNFTEFKSTYLKTHKIPNKEKRTMDKFNLCKKISKILKHPEITHRALTSTGVGVGGGGCVCVTYYDTCTAFSRMPPLSLMHYLLKSAGASSRSFLGI